MTQDATTFVRVATEIFERGGSNAPRAITPKQAAYLFALAKKATDVRRLNPLSRVVGSYEVGDLIVTIDYGAGGGPMLSVDRLEPISEEREACVVAFGEGTFLGLARTRVKTVGEAILLTRSEALRKTVEVYPVGSYSIIPLRKFDLGAMRDQAAREADVEDPRLRMPDGLADTFGRRGQ